MALVNTGKIDVNYVCYGLLAIEYAVQKGNLDIVKYLLKSSKAHVGNSIYYAIKHIEILKYLVKKRLLSVNNICCGNTPLMKACKTCNIEAFDYLVEYSNLNIKGEYDDTALHHCISSDFEYGAIQLINKGADINIMNDLKSTPLMYACYNKMFNVVSLLIAKGADVNLLNCKGRTALMVTEPHTDEAFKKRMKIVRLLIDNLTDVNVQDADGNTHLMRLCMYPKVSPNLKEYLKISRCVTNLVNNKGETALDIAISEKKEEIVKLLHLYESNKL